MAHSMGAWLVMETLRQMAIRDGRVTAKVQNVILASPDLDVDVFATQWRGVGQPPPVSLFLFPAATPSRRLAGNIDRVGGRSIRCPNPFTPRSRNPGST
jgi:esterase/lipase superfamily enzyme